MVSVPKCDLLLHTGDSTSAGAMNHLEQFLRWFDTRQATYKVMISGNHDFCFQEDLEKCRELLKQFDIIYLQDESVEIEGIKIYGSPWTPWYKDWAFNAPQNKEDGSNFLYNKWQQIPEDVDILMTHGPSYGILDRTNGAFKPPENIGCVQLLNRVKKIQPPLYVFGHLHEGYGMRQIGKTCFVNAATCTYPQMEPTNPPIELNWSEIKTWIQQ